MIDKAFCMRLANGQECHFSATERASQWLEKMASIMQLRRCKSNGHSKLIFAREVLDNQADANSISSLDLDLQRDLSRDGWRPHDLWDRNRNLLRFWSHPDMSVLICDIGCEEEDPSDAVSKMRLSMYLIYRQAQHSGGLPFHAALVERNGMGIVLAASTGGGKSTCCDRFPVSWRILCDDETLIVRGSDGRYMAHPFPTWSDHIHRRLDRTWNVQQHVPLVAIFFLDWAETDEIVPVAQAQAAIVSNKLAEQVVYYRGHSNLGLEARRAFARELLDNACELARAVPAFVLSVSLTGSFWEKIDEVLEGVSVET
jgi:SynChlorMet cassette protein ScmC